MGHFEHMMRALLPPLVVALLVTGCGDVPPLEQTIDAAGQDAPYPDLVAKEPLLAQGAEAAITPDDYAELQGRADALNARAAALPPDGFGADVPGVDKVQPAQLSPEEEQALRDRIERLRARAAALRQSQGDG